MEKLIAPLPSLIFAQRQCLEDGKNILFDRHLPKDRFLLRQIAHPEPGAFVHGIVRHICAGEDNFSAVWSSETNDDVETRGFTRAIRTEQTNDLARAHFD